MIVTVLTAALTLGQAMPAADIQPSIQRVQYGVPRHPPPCGRGWDVSARDGMCYPNGYLPPQEQEALQGYYRRGRGYGYGYGRYPVPCGNGADVDVRDGRCYPNGTVPPQFQQGRGYYGRRGYDYDED
ncbi:hypothetical protein QA640_22590 [Bradyrhizobium sp. CB82]|uniref:hypothetical protein n=1 Tax=Bradyrhizobium sp. CB82 TaxID=3039159 RepID=UPI0024B0FE5A|nr:hypothetical protein [Bradyrhizobium sp. CB82]WFU37285.1 hypothetical protein QA640_22590 [Bradyrhizobium sp. CB82]